MVEPEERLRCDGYLNDPHHASPSITVRARTCDADERQFITNHVEFFHQPFMKVYES